MSSVAVLMSTYNGEKYIGEQIESIFNQKECEVTLYIRDDGSTDDTLEIIERYRKVYDIKLYVQKNIGWKRSFMKLVNLVDLEYDYYAFSDQDDIWLEDKLNCAIKMLRNKTCPALYCSAQTMIDNKYNVLKIDSHRVPKNYRQGMTNIASRGCSEVFNNRLMMLLKKYNPPDCFSHDRWVARVAMYTGDICFDDNSYILYRQHDLNSSGNSYSPSFREKLDAILSNYINNDFYYWYAIELIKGYYNDIGTDKISWLETLVDSKKNWWVKIKLMISRDFISESIKGTILLKCIMILGLYQKEKEKK